MRCEAEAFWKGFSALVADLTGRNRELLEVRETLQRADRRLASRTARAGIRRGAYRRFLHEIGYLRPEGGDFEVETRNTDPEISHVAGPQLVVPITNARYALNAANARWGSLYDALYGTDALGDLPPAGGYDAERGARVIDFAKTFLDETFPLASGSHRDLVGYRVASGRLEGLLDGDRAVALADPACLVGHEGAAERPAGVLLRHNGLHANLVIDREHPIGSRRSGRPRRHQARGGGQRHHGLRGQRRDRRCRGQGTGLPQLARPDEGRPGQEMSKGGKSFTRRLNPDVEAQGPDGGSSRSRAAR